MISGCEIVHESLRQGCAAGYNLDRARLSAEENKDETPQR